ncbi:hypothetical protein [Nitratireductor luteus]|uniref:hypothetical protein n=1 Tax=Nitratireductor luteus TaxID=2976980 RepID=UPI00223FAC93|nr:hypothetical protein [Nitratireductor luteus]
MARRKMGDIPEKESPAPGGQTEAKVDQNEVSLLDVPEFFGDKVALITDSTSFTVFLSRQVPVLVRSQNAGTSRPAVTLHMSPQTAKDLALLLIDQIDQHEREWGQIETAFTRRRTQAEAPKKARRKTETN